MDAKDRSIVVKVAAGILPFPAGLGLLVGGCLWYAAAVDQDILDHTQKEPKAIQLSDLLAKGPGDNHHVRLTGFTFGAQVTVRSKEPELWTGVVTELLMPGQDQVKGPVLAVAFHREARGRQAIDQVSASGRMRCLVLQGLRELPSMRWGQLAELTEDRPGTDASGLLRVLVDPEFPDAAMTGYLWVAAYLFLGVGVVSGAILSLILLGGPEEEAEQPKAIGAQGWARREDAGSKESSASGSAPAPSRAVKPPPTPRGSGKAFK